MSEIHSESMTTWIEAPFVVLLIGIRLNRPWKVHRLWEARRAMKGLLAELEASREHGLLHYESFRGNPSLIVQYWRSWEHLETWAREPKGNHRSVWVDYAKRIKPGGDVGVWHETYVVRPGDYECIYTNMPRFGLGAIGELIKTKGRTGRASNRMEQGKELVR